MKSLNFFLSGALAMMALTESVVPATRYVNVNNPTPVWPYTSWATAATNIQDAVDAAAPGDVVLVTNGVYAKGGRMVYGVSNRVAVTKPVEVRSVNGPEVTMIVSSGPIGVHAVRCVYLTNGAVLIGFTLTNGAAQAPGDPYTYKSGGGVWCESAAAIISNCVISGNIADAYGGGAYGGTLYNSTLISNSASLGGGGYGSTLRNCMLVGNSASIGGGANNCSLYNCVLTENRAEQGGGANGGTLYSCTLTGNSARWHGGGAAAATLYNCIVYYNEAADRPNFSGGVLNYCCTTPLPIDGVGNIDTDPRLASPSHISENSRCRRAGNAAYATGFDIDGESWGDPPSIGCDEYWRGAVTGAVNVAIVASYTNVAVGFEVSFKAKIDGRVNGSLWDFGDGVVVSNRPYVRHSWNAPGDYLVKLRAFNETYRGGVTATVLVRVVEQPVHYVALDSPNPQPPYGSWTTAARNIQDAVDAAEVPGALVLVSNGIYQVGGRAVYGTSNRLAVTKPVVVLSVNGPESMVIRGYQVPGQTNGSAAVRCVYLTDDAVLAGFTLADGATQASGSYTNGAGGGVWCESVRAAISNCVIVGNSAYLYGGGVCGGSLYNCTIRSNSAPSGGGAWCSILRNCMLVGNRSAFNGGTEICTLYNCILASNSAQQTGGGAGKSTLYNCMLLDNSARVAGGGADNSTLYNCTVVGNTAEAGWGGGVFESTLCNSIIYYNSAPSDGNYSGSTLNFCCTEPLPSGGVGNIEAEPRFVNTNWWSNLRLQESSPCINAGTNAFVGWPTDLAGNPRISGGIVDMGAYEFQFVDLFRLWLQEYGLRTDGSDDYTDPDGDGHNNWQEWVAGTNPTNAASVLRMLWLRKEGLGVTVAWSSVEGRRYTLECGTNLGSAPMFWPIQTNIVGEPSITTWTDTDASEQAPRFYRVRVEQ